MRAALRQLVVLALPLLLALACQAPDRNRLRRESPPRPLADPGTGSAVGEAARAALSESPVAAAEPPLVVFLGDSLTAGYGLSGDEAFPAHVERLLAARGLPVRVVNAGVSGDTAAGGLERLGWFLRQEPEIVVVALGGNDGLRGQPPAATEANLAAILERIEASGARALLAGMRIPPNLGPGFVRDFEAIYPRLAERYDVPLVPFLLEGVAADPALNLPDGIHPNAEGQEIVARTVADALAPLVAEVERSSAEGAEATVGR